MLVISYNQFFFILFFGTDGTGNNLIGKVVPVWDRRPVLKIDWQTPNHRTRCQTIFIRSPRVSCSWK